MSDEYEQMIGKIIAGFLESGDSLRIDFADGTHFDLQVGGGDGGIFGEWIDDQEIADRLRHDAIMKRVREMHDRAHRQRAAEAVTGWNGWWRIVGEEQISEEEKEFMARRSRKE